MHLLALSRKEIGARGEELTARFLKRNGFRIVARNVVRKTGELDIVAARGSVLHIVEVKTVVRQELPPAALAEEAHGPAMNLHPLKLRKVARTGERYAANLRWRGAMQVDAVLVWLRARDGAARIAYLPQIL